MKRWRAGMALALLACVAAFWFFPVNRAPREEPPNAETEAQSEDAPVPLPTPSEPAPTASPAPVAAAPIRPAGELDPCAHDESDDTPRARPTLGALLDLRTSELSDRARVAFDHGASDALREGLAALYSDHPRAAYALLARAPDHRADGFDFALAALVQLGVRDLNAHDTRAAAEDARLALRHDPRDPLAHVLDALARLQADDDAGAREALRRAFELDRAEPAVALALALRLDDGPDPAEAVRALDVYLETAPDDVSLGRRRARLARRAAYTTGALRASRHGVTVLYPRDTISDREAGRALDTIDSALGEAARLLGVPRRVELTVIVYPTRAAMLAATCATGWTGALFDGVLHTHADTLRDVAETTRVLRHETLHAALHAEVHGAPLWFDEGVAQWFSGEEGPAHRHSYAVMLRGRTWIPFGSLDDTFQEIDDHRDAGLAYHQSFAMVALLLDRNGPRALADATRYLRDGGDPRRFTEHVLRGVDGAALLAFLARR